MRAWRVSGVGEPDDVLHLVDIEPPEPGPGMVRVDVHAAGVGLPDVFMCRGTYPLTPEGSFTPGQELCGTVRAVGDGVDENLVGQRLMGITGFYVGHGSFAEQALAASRTLYPVPDGMADIDGAGFAIPFHTAWIGLVTRGQATAGETLLVLGAAGSSGAAAVRLGATLGLTVIAVVGGPAKAAYCTALGAHHVIDHREVDDLSEAVRSMTDGDGADLIYDPVGGDPARGALRAIANEGRHLLVGFASGTWAEPRGHDVAVRNYSMVGVYAGAYDRAQTEAIHESVTTAIAEGPSIVGEVAAFEDLGAAVSRVADRSAIGKTVVQVAQSR